MNKDGGGKLEHPGRWPVNGIQQGAYKDGELYYISGALIYHAADYIRELEKQKYENFKMYSRARDRAEQAEAEVKRLTKQVETFRWRLEHGEQSD